MIVVEYSSIYIHLCGIMAAGLRLGGMPHMEAPGSLDHVPHVN
jgi:hypothetical protein